MEVGCLRGPVWRLWDVTAEGRPPQPGWRPGVLCDPRLPFESICGAGHTVSQGSKGARRQPREQKGRGGPGSRAVRGGACGCPSGAGWWGR
eukprot:3271866-Prymnesium_polylepis.1